MMHILLFLILSISPATQTDRLFVASDSLFNYDGIITLGSQDGWRFHLRELLFGGQTGTIFSIVLPIN
jgi:hypothetical protein